MISDALDHNFDSELTPGVKFMSYDHSGNEIAFDYDKVYDIVGRRLTVAASKNQIDLILKLCSRLTPPFYVLYVLVVSRLGNEPGRYQSPQIDTFEDLIDFLLEYKEFFETDGRHHLWIATTNNSGRLIYDQHNVIFAYGQNDTFVDVLNKEGFVKQEFSFPSPHAHAYHDNNDKYEKAILECWDWYLFPLADGDEYD